MAGWRVGGLAVYFIIIHRCFNFLRVERVLTVHFHSFTVGLLPILGCTARQRQSRCRSVMNVNF